MQNRKRVSKSEDAQFKVIMVGMSGSGKRSGLIPTWSFSWRPAWKAPPRACLRQTR